MEHRKKIAIIGGGPAGLFAMKYLSSESKPYDIHIFEKSTRLGAGMPYSSLGANREHITNVSGNEIPELPQTMQQWLIAFPEKAAQYGINPETHSDFRVLPRLLFGDYLEYQFGLVIDSAQEKGILVTVHFESEVKDVSEIPQQAKVAVDVHGKGRFQFESVIISTGHVWPHKFEGEVSGYYDSPYPPSKLIFKANHAIGIKGASLTAIDAVRTLSRLHGDFTDHNGELEFTPHDDCPDFKIVMHSRSGLLPAIRFHLEDTQLSKDRVITPEQISEQREKNDGFLPLDFVYNEIFIKALYENDRDYYDKIKDLTLEQYVESILDFREDLDPFLLFRSEYREAEKSIRREQSVYWKEALATLSFALNYPAKYFSAEDMLRLQKTLMPLISVVIAFVPQSSCRELLALHNAGRLQLTAVGKDGEIFPSEQGAEFVFTENGTTQKEHFKTFIDCTGQPHLAFTDFPFTGLISDGSVSPALLRFKNERKAKSALRTMPDRVIESLGEYYLRVPGLTINDNFQVTDNFGAYNERIFVMAVPHIGGLNPDYSGLDFCEAAAQKVAKAIHGE